MKPYSPWHGPPCFEKSVEWKSMAADFCIRIPLLAVQLTCLRVYIHYYWYESLPVLHKNNIIADGFFSKSISDSKGIPCDVATVSSDLCRFYIFFTDWFVCIFNTLSYFCRHLPFVCRINDIQMFNKLLPIVIIQPFSPKPLLGSRNSNMFLIPCCIVLVWLSLDLFVRHIEDSNNPQLWGIAICKHVLLTTCW